MKRLVCFLLGTLAACDFAGERAVEAAALALEPCRIQGLSRVAWCGVWPVPEDRDRADGRTIPLRIVVVRASGRNPAPDPVFFLAGGPGQAASEAYPPMLATFSRLGRDRDLVMVDQRGTGQSLPLDCDPGDRSLAEQLGAPVDVDALRQCLERLDADPTRYHTSVAAEDLDEVRRALGYDRINLIGGSYGTRMALVYMRMYGDHVRSVVLDGVAPPDMALPLTFARDAQLALDRLLADCEASETCRAAWPDLAHRLDSLLDILAKEPARVVMAHPRTGERVELVIDRETFALGIRALLYVPELSVMVPLIVSRAATGDFAAFVAAANTFAEGIDDELSIGMFLSVVCTEDVPALNEERIAAATTGTMLGRALIDRVVAACAVWPRGQIPGEFVDPVKSQVETLVLSGALDPVTPPSWGEAAAQHLSRSRHVVVPGAGHGTLAVGCVPGLVADFVEAGTVEPLDSTCVEDRARPPFFIDLAGPPS